MVLFQNHDIFGNDVQALQIVLYFDDCDLCNSTGSRVTKHKIAFFYFTLGNLLHECCSKLDASFLLVLVKSSHLKNMSLMKYLSLFFGFEEIGHR